MAAPPPDLHHQLHTRGHVVLRCAFDAPSCAEIARLFDGLDPHALGPADAWGVEVVPLLDRLPQLARFLDAPALVAGIEEALGGAARRLFDGARLTHLGGGGFLPWHFHADLAGSDGRWDPTRTGAPRRIERVVATAYLDGANTENGPLWVLPRACGDPWAPPSADPTQPWPGQVELVLAPGDVVVWDVATYHAAWCHRGPRRIFGGIYARAE